MDKISHCELTQDAMLITTDEGKRLCISRDVITKLAFAIVHFQKQDSVDLGAVLQDGFNWTTLKPAKVTNTRDNISTSIAGCKNCSPTDWKPKKHLI